MRRNSSLISRFLAVAVVVAASVFYVSGQESDGVLLNKRPLRDFGDEVKRDVDAKKVDLSGPFLVEFRGKVDSKGKIDIKSSSFARTEGDPALVETVRRGILAISDAGFLQYLHQLQAKEFSLFVEQNSEDFQTRISMESETATRAQSIRSMIQLLIAVSKQKKQEATATEVDKQDLFILNASKVEAEGRSVVVSFKAPAAEVQKLVAEKLAEHSKNGQ